MSTVNVNTMKTLKKPAHRPTIGDEPMVNLQVRTSLPPDAAKWWKEQKNRAAKIREMILTMHEQSKDLTK